MDIADPAPTLNIFIDDSTDGVLDFRMQIAGTYLYLNYKVYREWPDIRAIENFMLACLPAGMKAVDPDEVEVELPASNARKPRQARLGAGEYDVKGIAALVGASTADIYDLMKRGVVPDKDGRRLIWYERPSLRHRSGREAERKNTTRRFIGVNFQKWWREHNSSRSSRSTPS